MDFELQCAEGVRDPFKGVFQRVRIVVHRVDAPLVTVPKMVGAPDPVDHRVAHVDVGRSHIDAGAQHHRAVFELPGPHPGEKIEVLLDGAGATGGFPPRSGQVAPVGVPLLGGEVADVGFAVADQPDGALVHLLKVVARVIDAVSEIETEPADVAGDRIDVFGILLGRVGVVEPEVAAAVVLCGDAEVEADRLGVADMQVAVGFGGEAGDHFPVIFSGAIVFGDHLADEVEGFAAGCVGFCHD